MEKSYKCPISNIDLMDLVYYSDLKCWDILTKEAIAESVNKLRDKSYGSDSESIMTYFNKHFDQCPGCNEFVATREKLTRNFFSEPLNNTALEEIIDNNPDTIQ